MWRNRATSLRARRGFFKAAIWCATACAVASRRSRATRPAQQSRHGVEESCLGERGLDGVAISPGVHATLMILLGPVGGNDQHGDVGQARMRPHVADELEADPLWHLN